jgi:UDP-GlcNAc:undecaprenyl-phosphate GlcNAc-1-phosphate transferase
MMAPEFSPSISAPGTIDPQQAVAQAEAALKAAQQHLSDVKVAAGIAPATPAPISGVEIASGYLAVFFVAFAVTVLVVPLIRKLAIANGIVDHPNEARKVHRLPVAYLGGVAVYLGMLAAIGFAFFTPLHGALQFHPTRFLTDRGIPELVPLSIVFGMTVVMLVGFWDDVAKVTPMQKVGGQLIAAALLAMNDIGTNVARQLLTPIGSLIGNPDLRWVVPIPGMGDVPIDLIYWAGVVIIAVFVLGACNASNLIDGLDGLLAGVTVIAGLGLLFISVWMAQGDAGHLDAARIILCLALIGACLGYLPHNWNPASIFMGDAGSLLLGYTTIVIVLTLGNEGATNLVIAGLVIYSIPIIDTTLAIVRRKLAGQSISSADSNHLHHILKRSLGVKGAVLVLYALGAVFAIMGVLMIYGRARLSYALFMVLAAFIAVTAIKAARRFQLEEQARKLAEGAPAPLPATPATPAQPEAQPTPAGATPAAHG